VNEGMINVKKQVLCRKPNNTRQLWVITNGECDNLHQTALAAQQLVCEVIAFCPLSVPNGYHLFFFFP
jgi:hypothetical protein